MDRLRVRMDGALGVEVGVELASGKSTAGRFDGADLHDLVAIDGRESGGFEVKKNMSHTGMMIPCCDNLCRFKRAVLSASGIVALQMSYSCCL